MMERVAVFREAFADDKDDRLVAVILCYISHHIHLSVGTVEMPALIKWLLRSFSIHLFVD